MRIVLIGPVYPYKGGIAHYTSLLCRALRERHEVFMISYKMQYPKILFKKEQKDYSNKSFQVEDTGYWINTANPFNLAAVAHKIKKLAPDAVILQWWHPYFAPCYWILAKLLRKTKLIITCHNVFPHERFPMDRFLTKLVLRQADGYVVQSHLDEKDLLTIKADADYVVTPHPTYNAFRMKGMDREEARRILGIDSAVPMLLFFGFVREYKGLQYLLDALPEVRERFSDITLWVVGDFGDDKDRYLEQIERNHVQDSIRLVEGYVPDQEVEKYFAAADLVALPYVSATQSGIVQIAYGFEKPVVVTDVGGLPDVVRDGETGYVVPACDAHAIADAVIRFCTEGAEIDWQGNIRKQAQEFSWATMTERLERLITAVNAGDKPFHHERD